LGTLTAGADEAGLDGCWGELGTLATAGAEDTGTAGADDLTMGITVEVVLMERAGQETTSGPQLVITMCLVL
jgi:uncharacterized protein YraI